MEIKRLEIEDRLPSIEASLFVDLKKECLAGLPSDSEEMPELADEALAHVVGGESEGGLEALAEIYVPEQLNQIHEIWFFHFDKMVKAYQAAEDIFESMGPDSAGDYGTHAVLCYLQQAAEKHYQENSKAWFKQFQESNGA